MSKSKKAKYIERAPGSKNHSLYQILNTHPTHPACLYWWAEFRKKSLFLRMLSLTQPSKTSNPNIKNHNRPMTNDCRSVHGATDSDFYCSNFEFVVTTPYRLKWPMIAQANTRGSSLFHFLTFMLAVLKIITTPYNQWLQANTRGSSLWPSQLKTLPCSHIQMDPSQSSLQGNQSQITNHKSQMNNHKYAINKPIRIHNHINHNEEKNPNWNFSVPKFPTKIRKVCNCVATHLSLGSPSMDQRL